MSSASSTSQVSQRFRTELWHSTFHSGNLQRAVTLCFWPLLAVVCISGCNGCDRDSSPAEGPSVVQPHTASTDQSQGATANQPGGPTRTESLASQSPPVDPTEAAQFAEVSNPYAGTFRGVFAMEGQGGVAFFVDGQLAYPAMTCINPECPAKGKGDNGAPYLFVREFKDVQQGPDGQIIWPANPEITADPVCPACQQNGTIRPYVLPSTARRMDELKAELAAARQAYTVARQQGLEKAPGVRTPREVMMEMESLKQLYLVPKSAGQGK